LLLAILQVAAATPAHACRELVVFPEHLEIGAESPRANYYVVKVLKTTDEAIEGQVLEAFGGSIRASSRVTFYFIPNQEPHAVCAVPFKAGETRLIRVPNAAGRPEISRFNWMNISSSHERYTTYLTDLRSTP